jgi:hypothetical protein
MGDESHPHAAIDGHRSGTLDGVGLMRALVSWDHWVAPADIGEEGPGPLLAVVGDERWFPACTGHDALMTYAAALGRTFDSFLEIDGVSLFRSLGDHLTGVNIDPYSDHAIHYRPHQFADLRQMAGAVEVERILHGADIENPMQKLRDYDGYRVVMRAKDEGRSELMLAPDGENRLLAAVFTAPDTLQAFLDQVVARVDMVPIVVTLDGTELYTKLRQILLHGIVFNCRGPVPAKALSAQLAQEVLERTSG